jgi:hypothetical protein
VEALIRRGVESGELRAENADLDGWLLGGMVRSLSVREFREGRKCEARDIDHLVDVFLRGAGT